VNNIARERSSATNKELREFDFEKFRIALRRKYASASASQLA